MEFNEIFECFMDFGFSYDDKFLIPQLVYHIMTNSVFTSEIKYTNLFCIVLAKDKELESIPDSRFL